uniref:C-type lectin domain-containing protein n=1 Tax=Ditylenchus dipsaci TaxID=166011 RepID=A0A915DKF0_9BILA
MKVVQGSTPAAIHIGRDCSCQKDQYFTWDDGERKCLEEQSHLASVHSYEENDKQYFVQLYSTALLPQKAWLGYRRHDIVNNQPSSFSNIDGSDTSFVPTAFRAGLYPWSDG